MGKKSKSKGSKPKKERLGAKGFAKSYPEMAEQLRNGSLRPGDVANTLSETAFLERVGGGVRDVDNEGNWHLRVCLALAALGASETDELEVQRFGIGLYFEWQRRLEDFPTVVDGNTSYKIAQEAFDDVCDCFMDQIEAHTKKPLTSTCPIYRVPLWDFRSVFYVLMKGKANVDAKKAREIIDGREEFNILEEEFFKSAVGVKAGTDRIRYVCWECDKECQEKLYCVQCGAARYCSKTCQREAWYSGHKYACSDIKKYYENHASNYRRIDRAVKEGVVEEGSTLPPSPIMDYQSLRLMDTRTDGLMSFGESFLFPSIDVMYKNLAKIVRGERHWVFRDKFTGTLGSLAQEPILEIEDQEEEASFVIYQHILAFDVDGATSNLAAKRFISHTKKKLRHPSLLCGKRPMPVNRFIELYYRSGLDTRNIETTRWDSITLSFSMLKDHYHKSTMLNDPETFFTWFSHSLYEPDPQQDEKIIKDFVDSGSKV